MPWQARPLMQWISILGIAFFSIFAPAKDLWTVKKQDNAYVLERNGKTHEIEYSTVKPEIKKIIQHEGYEIVVFLQDVAGTKVMVEIYAGAVYSRSKKKIVGIEPYRYINVSDNKSKIAQPKWSLNKNGSIVVNDPESGTTKTFD